MNTLREAIIEIVEDRGAIKATELAMTIASNDETRHLVSGQQNQKNYFQTVEEMVKNGEIMEIEYVTPQMSYRAKSIYLPKGTKIKMSLRGVEIEKL